MPTSWKGTIRSSTRRLTRFAHSAMLFPPYSRQVANELDAIGDDVRYAAIALAIQNLEAEHIAGAFAELGVWRGDLSRFIHMVAPDRKFYLFDTFEGFPDQALNGKQDTRFRDTSEQYVVQKVGASSNIVVRKGFFPATSQGLEAEQFAFVMLDFDLFQSAMDSFTFFYPRLVRGSYFFLHDYNSIESEHAISRAAREFLRDKPELLIEIPDICGSAVFRKL